MTLRSPTDLLEVARSVLPVFAGSRLVAMRELVGRTQAEVAEATGISPSALSQAERGDTTLSAANIALVASLFKVSPEAFVEQPEPEVDLVPQFRHLRRTPKREQRKAEQLVYATAQVANVLQESVQFPEPFECDEPVDPDRPIEEARKQVERASARTREALGVPPEDPIGDDGPRPLRGWRDHSRKRHRHQRSHRRILRNNRWFADDRALPAGTTVSGIETISISPTS